MHWYDALGLTGVTLIIWAYLRLQLGLMESRAPAYSLLNALGAALVLGSLAFNFNIAAFAVESFWLCISLAGLRRSFDRPASTRNAVK